MRSGDFNERQRKHLFYAIVIFVRVTPFTKEAPGGKSPLSNVDDQ